MQINTEKEYTVPSLIRYLYRNLIILYQAMPMFFVKLFHWHVFSTARLPIKEILAIIFGLLMPAYIWFVWRSAKSSPLTDTWGEVPRSSGGLGGLAEELQAPFHRLTLFNLFTSINTYLFGHPKDLFPLFYTFFPLICC